MRTGYQGYLWYPAETVSECNGWIRTLHRSRLDLRCDVKAYLARDKSDFNGVAHRLCSNGPIGGDIKSILRGLLYVGSV